MSSASRLETQQFSSQAQSFGKAFEKTRTGPANAEKASEGQVSSTVGDREAEKGSCESAKGLREIIISQEFSPAEEERAQFDAFTQGTEWGKRAGI